MDNNKQSPQTLAFRIHGMDCAEEVAVLKREVGPLAGGEDRLGFDILNGKMTVKAANPITADQVKQAVAQSGLRADDWSEAVPTTTGFWESNRRIILMAACAALTVAAIVAHAVSSGSIGVAFGFDDSGHPPTLAIVLYALGILAGAWTVLPKAWIAAQRLSPDMNLLMVVAITGAAALGQWLEGATVAFLFAMSLTLEAWSVGRARRAVAALMNLTPPTTLVIGKDGRESSMPSDQVAVGTIFLVRPGDRIPLDGKVIEGESAVNQAPITGESVPVDKGIGDEVFAGTINGDAALKIESTKPSSDTTLAHITRMVGEAQSRRSPSEQWVEKFARIYTPVVMIVAILVILVPTLLFAQPWGVWIYRSLVLLVIACPCALVISTPVSIVAALAAAARSGVLIKGGVYVEAPASVRAIALDKTGTLTTGKPKVVEIVALSGHTEEELLEIAAALESQSTHPLAKAVLEYASQRGVHVKAAESFEIVQGKGASGRVNGVAHWLGSHRYLEDRKQETPEVHERLESLAKSGRSVVVIGNDQHVCGFLALADTVRPESIEAVRSLQTLGVRPVVMLTGDNHGTAEAIARETGVDEYRAELLPDDKVREVEALVGKYQFVAMVGDGVNDAPAMARATFGVAMGAVGTDVAIETADIALMTDDLTKLVWLIRHSRRALSIIRQNIIFALGVKAVFLVLALIGVATMWSAVAADSGATLVVIANALRLLRIGGSSPNPS